MTVLEPQIKCPECGSGKTYRDGFRYVDGFPIQRYLCRDCGFRFSDPNKPYKECQTNNKRQVCELLTRGSKNLSATEIKTVAGDQKQQNIKGKILEFAFHLKKQGRTQDTIKSYESALNSLITGGANLLDPESVKEALAFNETWNNTSKTMKTIVYDRFTGFLGLKWDKPKYKAQKKIAFIPTEEEIDGLIAASPKKTATILQLLKETGARIGEACKLEWIDVNQKALTITINFPEKNSNPRILRISSKLANMLNALPKKGERLFHKTTAKTAQLCLSRARKRAALKLQNPRINQITHHTFRHWRGTMSYHETKDILHVQQLLGHKKIDSTLIYVNLESAIFQTENDNFHVKTAETSEEITRLLEVGFEYVCEKDGLIYLRKRK
jgi:integrase/rubredoxin